MLANSDKNDEEDYTNCKDSSNNTNNCLIWYFFPEESIVGAIIIFIPRVYTSWKEKSYQFLGFLAQAFQIIFTLLHS